MARNEKTAGDLEQLSINGQAYIPAGPWTWSIQSVKKEKLPNGRGRKETDVAPFCEGPISIGPDVSLAEIDITGGTVVIVAPDGTLFTFRGADQVGEMTYNSDEGQVTARFEADGADEVKP